MRSPEFYQAEFCVQELEQISKTYGFQACEKWNNVLELSSPKVVLTALFCLCLGIERIIA